MLPQNCRPPFMSTQHPGRSDSSSSTARLSRIGCLSLNLHPPCTQRDTTRGEERRGLAFEYICALCITQGYWWLAEAAKGCLLVQTTPVAGGSVSFYVPSRERRSSDCKDRASGPSTD